MNITNHTSPTKHHRDLRTQATHAIDWYLNLWPNRTVFLPAWRGLHAAFVSLGWAARPLLAILMGAAGALAIAALP